MAKLMPKMYLIWCL